jgi:HAD superfamily hydrolase (TIGR01509 family)
MKRDYSLVLFDFDGTLADTLPLIYHVFRLLFREHAGRELTDREIFSLFGPTETGIIRKHFPTKDTESIIRQMHSLYDSEHEAFVKPHPGVLPMLHTIRGAGYKIGLYSGKSRITLDISLSHLGFGEYFLFTLSGDDVMRTKPHPEGVIRAAEMAETTPARVLFVGDSDHDTLSAVEAGATIAGAHWLPDGSNFRERKPELMFEDPLELARWLTDVHQ